MELYPLKTMVQKNVSTEEIGIETHCTFNLTEDDIQDECFGKTCKFSLNYADWRITLL